MKTKFEKDLDILSIVVLISVIINGIIVVLQIYRLFFL